MSASAEDSTRPTETTGDPAIAAGTTSSVLACVRETVDDERLTGCSVLDVFERRVALATFLEAALLTHQDRTEGCIDDFREALVRFGAIYQQASSNPKASLANVGLELCRLLQVLCVLAEETLDNELWQRGLEWLVCAKPQGSSRAQAYAALAEFLSDRIGDLAQAGKTWELAAREAEATVRDRGVSLGYWERVFAIQADDPDVASHLVRGYAASGDWASVTAPFDVILRKASTRPLLLACVELLLELKPLAIEHQQFDVYVALVDHVLWGVTRDNAELSRDLLRAKSQVLSATRDRFDAAIEAYYALIDAHAREEDVDELIAFIRADANPIVRYGQLVRLYEWRIARTTDPIPHYLQWAKFEECDFANIAAAAGLCERVVTQKPDHIDALRELRRLYAMEFDWAGVEHAIERLSPLLSEPERSQLDFERAELLLSQLDRPDAALEVIVAAISRGADPAPTRPWLQRLLSAEHVETRLDAAAQLIESFGNTPNAEQYEALRRVLAATEDLASMDSGPGSLRASALRLQWFEKVLAGWPCVDEDGFRTAEKAVAEFPDSDALWDALRPWSSHPEFAERVIALCRTAIERETDRELIERLGKRMVSFAEATTVEVDSVLETLVDVMRLVPGWRWALDRVKLHLGAKGRFEELLELYDRAADEARINGDTAGEILLLNEASVAAKDLASDPERAIRYLERLVELEPKDLRLHAALERLYERCGQTEPLIAHLLRRLPELASDEAHQVKERIASLWTSLGRYDLALEIIEEECALRGESPRAAELLEQVAQAPDARLDGDEGPSTAERATELLVRLYRRLGKLEELARAAAFAVEIATATSRQIAALNNLGEVYESLLLDIEHAYQTVSLLIGIAPTDPQARQWHGRLAERLGRFDDQVETLLRAAESLPQGNEKGRVLYEAAVVTNDRLSDPTRAIELLGQVVEVCVDDRALVTSALASLEQLLRSEGYAEERCNALECLIESTDDKEQRRYAQREAARLCAIALNDPERAASHFRAILDDNPSDPEALDGFAEALSQQERWEDLAQTLLYRIGLPGDPRNAISDRRRLAELYATKLGEPDSAIAEWQAIIRDDPNDSLAVERISDLLAQTERWDELVLHLTAQLPHASDPDSIYRRLAEIHRCHTRDLRAAVIALSSAHDIQSAAELLWGEQGLQIDDVKLRLSISDALRGLGQVQAAIRVLSVQVELYGERRPKERSLVHLALARALLTIDDPQLSLRELSVAIAIDPTNPEILAMHGKLALELAELDEAEQSYRALLLLAMHASEVQVQLPALSVLYFRLAQIAERREQSERALELETSAFEAAFSRPSELLELELALLELRSDARLMKTLDLRLSRASDLEQQAGVLLEFTKRRMDYGELSPEFTTRLRLEMEKLTGALADEGRADVVLRALQPLVHLFRLLSEGERILPMLRHSSERFACNEELGPQFQALYARTLLTYPEMRTAAIAQLLSVWAEGKGLLDVADDLLEALGEDGRFEEQAMILEQRVACAVRAKEDGQANALRMELGATLERAGNQEAALAAYESVVAGTKPHRRAALEAQSQLLRTLGESHSGRLLSVLEGLVALSEGRAAAEAALQLSTSFSEEECSGQSAVTKANVQRAMAYGVDQDPTLTPLRRRYVADLIDAGDMDSARQVLQMAHERHPNDCAIVLDFVSFLESTDEVTASLELMQRFLDEFPQDIELNRKRWQLLVRLGRQQEALDALEREYARGAVSPIEFADVIAGSGLAEQSRSLRFREIELLLKGHAEDKATARLADWIAGNNDDVQAHREYARLAVKSQRWGDAATSLAQLVQIDSAEGAVAAALDLAVACDKLGDPARAVPALERAKRFAKDHEELDLRLLSSYEALKMYGRMAELYVSRGRRSSVPQVRADLLLLAAQNFARASTSAEALRCLDEALAIEPDRVSLVVNKAQILSSLGALTEAREVLLAALDANRYERITDRQQLLFELAMLHLQMDELIEAHELLGRAFGLDPDEPRIALQFGLVAADVDDIAVSKVALNAALAAKRTNEHRTQLLAGERAAAFAELSRQELAAGHSTSALELFEKAVEQDANHHAVVNLSRTMQALVG